MDNLQNLAFRICHYGEYSKSYGESLESIEYLESRDFNLNQIYSKVMSTVVSRFLTEMLKNLISYNIKIVDIIYRSNKIKTSYFWS